MKALLDRLAAPKGKMQQTQWRVPGRIAYVVSHSYPYSSNGYAVRTHGVATALVQHGHSVVAINRPGRPWDLPGFDNDQFPLHHEIEGVRYLHLQEPSLKRMAKPDYLVSAADALKNVLKVFKPTVVMAASNWENALPAAVAAREFGLPFFYEVRGFWEITRISREPEWKNSVEFQEYVGKETAVAQAAERVFTLNRFMQDELVQRGIDAGKIDLVPNAYGAMPDQYGSLRRGQMGHIFGTRHLVGYFGSFNAYEGLDDLVRACAQLRQKGVDLSLLLVGSFSPVGIQNSIDECPESIKLRQLAQELGFSEHLHLPGRVAPEDLSEYYAITDLVVIPRKALPVCELVSPIKPLEAAAFGKAMLVSDVGPLKEIVEESGTGELFKAGDIGALSQKINQLLLDSENRNELGRAAQKWVAERRTWLKSTESIIGTPELVPAQSSFKRRDPVSSTSAARLRVACVMDEFTFHSFEPECDLLQLTPNNALSEMDAFNPDLLFIESAWRGKDELWDRKIGTLSPELRNVLAWCKKRRIPTVFWNKEDPIHFETFLTTAQQFDHVFTTDIDCINRYKAALGHNRVYLLPFACQPAMHNPIETYERKDAFCFAGAYYVRYPERTRDLGNFVKELPKFRPLEIFDRNFGKDDVNYQFPPEYQPYIVGTLPFNEIDKAYKGYRYAINLNSIKQSQTMFARRVYELLGSNTVTVSNFSRGVRLLFGDLIITTDNGSEMVGRLQQIAADEETSGKLRLAGLRKVIQEHTYSHRLSYVAAKALNRPIPDTLPAMLVVGYAKNQAEYDALVGHFQRQSYNKRRLVIVLDENLALSKSSVLPRTPRVTIKSIADFASRTFKEVLQAGEWLAPLVAEDYYGPNYLLDIALATAFCKTDAIGKAAQYQVGSKGLDLTNAHAAYRRQERLSARCSAIKGEKVTGLVLRDWLTQIGSESFVCDQALSIDPYNYCRAVGPSPDLAKLSSRVDDMTLDTGIPIGELLKRAEKIPPLLEKTKGAQLTATKLAEHFGPLRSELINFEVAMGNWRITSRLPDGKHEYLYANNDLIPSQVCSGKVIKSYLDVTPGLNVQFVTLFLDSQKKRISHVIQTANRNQSAEIPPNTAFIRLGLRVYGGGQADIKTLQWEHRTLEPGELLGQREHLLLTNQYPTYDDLYRNGFVHSRVKAYSERGVGVDVFRLRQNEPVSYHEFQDVDVTTGSQAALDKMLACGKYKSVLVHFLNPEMWEVLEKHVDNLKIFVWVHGAEIQPWYRRDFNNRTEQERDAAKAQSEVRMAFWRGLLSHMPGNLRLIFVSRYLAEVVMEDLGFRLDASQYLVIHNAINTKKFAYIEKPAEQRKKILSIRPYASRTYANDLSVKAILSLSKKPFFNDLQFNIIGDGKLFDEILSPLRQFNNISIERRFLTQVEIAEFHREYGIFLCPSRMDTQGVSRDEAMSSGLVPITNNVAAIPEFIDKNSGILTHSEDAEGLAEGIAMLYKQPDKFLSMSKAASERVRRQSSDEIVIEKELSLILEHERKNFKELSAA